MDTLYMITLSTIGVLPILSWILIHPILSWILIHPIFILINHVTRNTLHPKEYLTQLVRVLLLQRSCQEFNPLSVLPWVSVLELYCSFYLFVLFVRSICSFYWFVLFVRSICSFYCSLLSKIA